MLSTMSRCADYFGIFKMATVAIETAKMLKKIKISSLLWNLHQSNLYTLFQAYQATISA
jgi:hypothetical protein